MMDDWERHHFELHVLHAALTFCLLFYVWSLERAIAEHKTTPMHGVEQGSREDR